MPRWIRWPFLISILVTAVVTFVQGSTGEAAQTWLTRAPWLEAAAAVFIAIQFAAMVGSPIYRYRREANSVQRQQLKWVALAGALGAGGIVASFGFGFGLSFGLEQYSGLNALLVLGSILGMHLATVVAILRYRLYDIDVFLNRTLVYGLLTAALAGISSPVWWPCSDWRSA